MQLKIKLGLIFLLTTLISACANGPLKAPCNQYANFCGTKTKINHW